MTNEVKRNEDTVEPLVRKPHPGDVFFDRTGCVSHSVPATYVVLSGEPSDDRHGGWEYGGWEYGGWEYRCWCARACNDGWMGGPVTIMWDTDLARLEHVGQVPMAHLANGATCAEREAGKAEDAGQ